MKNFKLVDLKVPVVALLATVLYAMLFLYGPKATGESTAVAVDPAAPVPVWSLKDITGKTIQSSDLKGKVVILDFWATWCGPCHEEIPGFIALKKQYGDQGLEVVGTSVDEGGAAVVKKFADNIGFNYPVGLADDKIQETFGGIDVLPTTLILDRQGRIAYKHVGFTEKSEFEKEIKTLLSKKN